jgi:predicted transcriptional regulator
MKKPVRYANSFGTFLESLSTPSQGNEVRRPLKHAQGMTVTGLPVDDPPRVLLEALMRAPDGMAVRELMEQCELDWNTFSTTLGGLDESQMVAISQAPKGDVVRLTEQGRLLRNYLARVRDAWPR